MPFQNYSLSNWDPDPVRVPTVAEFTASGGTGGAGNPDTLVFIASINKPDIGIQLFHRYAEGGPSGAGVTVTFRAENADGTPALSGRGDGKHFSDGLFYPDGWMAGEVGFHAFGEDAPAQLTIQAGYDDGSFTIDDPPTEPPDGIHPPTNLVASAEGPYNRLTWSDNSDNELGFKIEWSPVDPETGLPTGVWTKFAEVPTDVALYDDYDIVEGEIYGYRVYAFKADKQSIYSNEATTDAAFTIVPDTGPSGGGTPFTITGPGDFDPAATTTVLFDTAAATDLVVTAEAITGRTPAHAAGVVPVALTNGTLAATIPDAFTYTAGRLYPHVEATATPEVFPAPVPSSVILTAVIVDDVDGIFDDAAYRWALLASPSPAAAAATVITAPDSPATAVTTTLYQEGTFVFEVVVTGTDLAGHAVTIRDTASVVLASSGVPRVQSGMLTAAYPASVTLAPVITDDGWNGPLTYAWSQTSGPGTATIATPNAPTTDVTLPEIPGVYVFQLVVANARFSGVGIWKVAQSTSANPVTPIIGRSLDISIDGMTF